MISFSLYAFIGSYQNNFFDLCFFYFNQVLSLISMKNKKVCNSIRGLRKKFAVLTSFAQVS